MAPPSASRQSPGSMDLQNSQGSMSIGSYVTHTEIPSALELRQLVLLLRERRAQVQNRRRSLKGDESSVLQGRVSAGHSTLSDSLDMTEEASLVEAGASVSPTTTTTSLFPPPTPARARTGQRVSPSPRRTGPSASPAPNNSAPAAGSLQDGPNRMTKVKREGDREREGSESAVANGAPSTIALGVDGASASCSRLGSETSPGLDANWDDEAPSRPGRTYQAKRKRQMTSLTSDQDDQSLSEMDSPHPEGSQRASSQRETSINGRGLGTGLYASGSGPLSSSIKLKLNPTAHTAPMRNDTLSASIRRPSTLRGREDFGGAMTTMQASQAAMWELPKRTAETFIPKPAIAKAIRRYPTRPDEVDVDFAKMDWKERDRERDRAEAAAAASTTNGPGPGQAIVKEGTAASRARDRKQDQVAHHTFQQWVDGWFRTLTEEDLAWFSSKPDELEAFQAPALGRHYSEVWEEEEANGTLVPTTFLASGPTASATTTPVPASFAPLNGSLNRPVPAAATNAVVPHPSANQVSSEAVETPKFDPRTLKDDHLYGSSSEDARSGPFTERLLATLLPSVAEPASGGAEGEAGASGPTAAEGVASNGPVVNGSSAPAMSSLTKLKQDMAVYEERLRSELKSVEVVGEDEMDWCERADDEVSSALRQVQRLLRKQIRVNELRKTRLFSIAMDRMAYQDYLSCLNSVEREIESGWMKRQLQIKKSMQAQKKKKGSQSSTQSTSNPGLNGQVAAAAAVDGQGVSSPAQGGGASTPIGATSMVPSSSSLGGINLLPDRGGGPIRPQFSEALLSAMDKRKQLKYALEPMFAQKPLAKNTPNDESIYQDLELPDNASSSLVPSLPPTL